MKEGDIFKIKAPFLKDVITYDENGSIFENEPKNIVTEIFWRHGIRFEKGEYSSLGTADAEGFAEYKIVKIINMQKPYHDRLMFRKRLINPDGKIEKWQLLDCKTITTFKKILKGYKWNYEII